jgi:hypothetical protein
LYSALILFSLGTAFYLYKLHRASCGPLKEKYLLLHIVNLFMVVANVMWLLGVAAPNVVGRGFADLVNICMIVIDVPIFAFLCNHLLVLREILAVQKVLPKTTITTKHLKYAYFGAALVYTVLQVLLSITNLYIFRRIWFMLIDAAVGVLLMAMVQYSRQIVAVVDRSSQSVGEMAAKSKGRSSLSTTLKIRLFSFIFVLIVLFLLLFFWALAKSDMYPMTPMTQQYITESDVTYFQKGARTQRINGPVLTSAIIVEVGVLVVGHMFRPKEKIAPATERASNFPSSNRSASVAWSKSSAIAVTPGNKGP